MIIQSLKIEQFRHLNTEEFDFDPTFNLIVGGNASGKTSLLEAIYFLSHLKSFRTNSPNQIIGYNHDFFRIIAEVGAESLASKIGVERNKREIIVRKDYQTVMKRSLLARLLPVLFIGPDTGQLLMDNPRFRRQFLDWGLFQCDPNYHQLWLRFERSLKQRNAALKTRMNDNTLDAIEQELVATGEMMTVMRESFIELLFNPLESLLKRLVVDNGLWEIHYRKGYSSNNYGEELARSREQDRIVGYTRNGPHRSDFSISLEGKNVGQYLSRGQIKLTTIALMLAQIIHYRSVTGQSTILLIDDITAELDQSRRRILMDVLIEQSSQLFVTCLEKSEFPELYDHTLTSTTRHYKLTNGVAHKVV